MRHATRTELDAGLAAIEASPPESGTLEAIVLRRGDGERLEPESGELSPETGLHGDRWGEGSYGPDVQVTIMNARVAALISCDDRSRWALAGDNLVVDLDLSAANLPPGTRLAAGAAVLEVSATPHRGCGKFLERFGKDAAAFINSEQGRALNLRGINATVVQAGAIRVGDSVSKLAG